MSLDALAQRIGDGEALSEADANLVLEAHDLITVGMMADEVRRRMHGARTTFVRVFDIHVDAVPASLPGHIAAGEFRIIGQPQSIETAIAAVKSAVPLAGGLPITGFSLADLQALTGPTKDFRRFCTRLREAGLEAVAEVPLDLGVEHESAVADARGAGLATLRMTVSMLSDADRITITQRARDLQASLGGFRAFAPLPRTLSVAVPSTGYDDVKQVALARMLAINIESIQVDWALYGPKLAQVALTMGADDVDAVAAIDPGILGHRRSPLEEIRGNIRAAGLEPVERDGRFERRP